MAIEYPRGGSKVEITLERDGPFNIITMVNKDNRFNPDSMRAWNEALDDIEASLKKDKEQILVTRGLGKFYSNGLDIEYLFKSGDSSFIAGQFLKFLIKVLHLPIPTIALINGHAFAGGCLLALCHDYRIMTKEKGFICMNEVDLPSSLSRTMSAILRVKLPNPVEVRNSALLGIRYDSKTALKLGIIDAAADNDNLINATKEFASKINLAKIAKKSGIIYGLLKKSVYEEITNAYESEKDMKIDMKKMMSMGKL